MAVPGVRRQSGRRDGFRRCGGGYWRSGPGADNGESADCGGPSGNHHRPGQL